MNSLSGLISMKKERPNVWANPRLLMVWRRYQVFGLSGNRSRFRLLSAVTSSIFE